MIAVYEHDGRFSAATSGGILCHNVDRAEAARLIAEQVDGIDANEALDHPTDRATFRSTWAAAVAAEIQSLRSIVESDPEDIAHLKERLDAIDQRLHQSIEHERRSSRQQRLRAAEAALDAEANRIRAVLQAQKLHTAFAENFLWKTLWERPMGVLVLQLREES